MKLLATALCSLLYFYSTAQKPHNPSSSELLLKLKKLNFLGSVLYVAAHPDDENTRLIAYLSNETLANTAYLSLTRGDGGQNLIGPEIREGLGIIRTQELLAARRIDGGQQFFSRANDFGYSKSTDETQQIWNREQVLEDVVWTYRKFKPDVIITRFPPDKRAGHGHHTTSAIFAQEAFKISGDQTSYQHHLKYTDTWTPKRLYMNTGRWWSPDINENTPGVIVIDVGEYNELLGTSYTEMAALSRSQHKSQGFGSTGIRGQRLEFLELQEGESTSSDIFEGVDTSWGRIEGGKKIESMISGIIKAYQSDNPSNSLKPLLEVRDEITLLKNEHWKKIKINEIDNIIKGMLGLYLEAKASNYSAAPGDNVNLNIEATNRSSIPIKLEMVTYDHLSDTVMSTDLSRNVSLSYETSLTIPQTWDYSQPYWLKEPGSLGTYKVDDIKLRGTPENAPAMDVRFSVDVMGTKLIYTVPLVYKWNDPVDGELYRPFVIVPAAFVNISEPVYLFTDDQPKKVEVTVTASQDMLRGEVSLDVPKDWLVKPSSHSISLAAKNEEQVVEFFVAPGKDQQTAEISAMVNVSGNVYDQSIQTIEYDHIPTQILMSKASAKAVKLDIKRKGNVIGYIHGAGDAIPASLREIGYEVWEMKDDEITADNLKKVDVVILGVRALNTNDRIDFQMPVLLDYVHRGGTMMVQYNTSFRLKTENYAPYPLKIGRDRVSEENANVRILNPKHVVLNTPNKITNDDFENWVQERGLYFPNEWDDNYEAILSSNDKGEDAKDGGLLIAKYGKGHYIYSGYSWFRQLPAGVPGAFKLFVNLVSLGQEEKPSNQNLTGSK